MSKQPTAAPDDKLGRLLELAEKMDAALQEIADACAKFAATYAADKAIEDARRKADYEQQTQAPFPATRTHVASQQSRIDGDNKPWEPKG